MATDFPFPAPEQIARVHSPSAPTRPFMILQSAMGVAMPVLFDFGCMAIACIAGILLYEVHRPLDGRGAWLLWAELFLQYGLVFVILARAHHLYTQRDTLLQVADTAQILSVSVYSVILLSVGTYFTKSNMPR
jgi:hypothetical protein